MMMEWKEIIMLNLNKFPTIEWPQFRRVRQTLPGPREADVALAVRREIAQVEHLITPGKTYALGVGSRGIANIALITRTILEEIRHRGSDAVIIPAMASHGGATPDGQKEVLASFGITEDAMRAPIDARMDVAMIDHLPNGTPIYFSRAALDTDGIIPVNRIKLHTAFHGPIESGLTKMLVIGFGKQRGAAAIHSHGFSVFDRLIPEVGRILVERLPIIFGVGILENGYEETALVRALPSEQILTEEPRLMNLARQWMAQLPFDNIDVLVVGQIGKDISGDGMDPNVTGRYGAVGISGGPTIGKMAVLNLTTETH
ncbi:MAG: nickel-dependent lactate racemase, partial [Firmicutes bacterium]|nr:nickel-dependent lactate racemase [Bacillota bacterium]